MLLGVAIARLEPRQRRMAAAQLAQQGGVCRACLHLELPIDERAGSVGTRAPETVDHVIAHVVVRRGQPHALAQRADRGNRRRGEVAFAAFEPLERVLEVLGEHDAQPDAESVGERFGEIIFEAFRTVRRFLIGRGAGEGQDSDLARALDGFEGIIGGDRAAEEQQQGERTEQTALRARPA